MADGSHIEWTDATWNPISGCSVVSPGCTNCYAMTLAGTRLKHHPSRQGLTQDTKAGPVWTGQVRFNEQWLDQPLRWAKPRRIFVCAHGDLFAEGVPDEWIDRVFAVMALAPQHTFHEPHCLKKNGTPAAWHWSLSERGQSGCIGRAFGPLSPPTCGRGQTAISIFQWSAPRTIEAGEVAIVRVGKKAAGRLLDGKEHSEFPA